MVFVLTASLLNRFNEVFYGLDFLCMSGSPMGSELATLCLFDTDLVATLSSLYLVSKPAASCLTGIVPDYSDFIRAGSNFAGFT